MAKTIEEAVYQVFGDIDFEVLIAWADLYKVEHHKDE